MMDTTISCVCPAKKDGSVRHPDGDRVTFKDPANVDFRTASNMRNSVRVLPGTSLAQTSEIATAMTEGYLLYGIESWTVRDASDKPVPVDAASVTEYILRNYRVAIKLGDVADEVFGETVLLPLLREVSSSSPSSPMDDSTSPESGPVLKPPTPLKRSSTTTSRMGATETATPSRAGDSNSSPNLESVGA
jgi:hypothetical protein